MTLSQGGFNNLTMSTIWLAFLTGLTTGGISCLAVQGGLLASSLNQGNSNQPLSRKESLLGVSFFLLLKLFSYTVLGFLLGLVGSALSLTPKVQGLMQIAAGLFMLATAARLLDLHPIFRYFVIQPPKWAFKIIKRESQTNSSSLSLSQFSNLYPPALLGALTVFIPCGITQAMMIEAVATGSAWLGAAITFAFVLGTSPIFFAVGAVVAELFKKKAFVYVSSLLILIMAIFSMKSGFSLFGISLIRPISPIGQISNLSDGKQYATIYIANNGYTSDTTNLKVGVPVVLKLVTQNTVSCSRAFVIPEFNIRKVLPATGIDTVEFIPTKVGTLAYSCSMGMYTGSFSIVP